VPEKDPSFVFFTSVFRISIRTWNLWNTDEERKLFQQWRRLDSLKHAELRVVVFI
jgi:hypothetical protein